MSNKDQYQTGFGPTPEIAVALYSVHEPRVSQLARYCLHASAAKFIAVGELEAAAQFAAQFANVHALLPPWEVHDGS